MYGCWRTRRIHMIHRLPLPYVACRLGLIGHHSTGPSMEARGACAVAGQTCVQYQHNRSAASMCTAPNPRPAGCHLLRFGCFGCHHSTGASMGGRGACTVVLNPSQRSVHCCVTAAAHYHKSGAGLGTRGVRAVGFGFRECLLHTAIRAAALDGGGCHDSPPAQPMHVHTGRMT